MKIYRVVTQKIMHSGSQIEGAGTDEELQKSEKEDKQQKIMHSGVHTEHGTWNQIQWRQLPKVSKRFTITVNRK